MNIFTMVYGDYHVGLFKDACFRSLNWPKNLESITGNDWCIYTKKEHFKDLETLFKDKPYNLVLFELGEFQFMPGLAGQVKTVHCDPSVILLNGLRTQVQYCIERGQKMLFAPPDTVFGDGSVSNILKAGEQPGTAVMVAHPRVLPQFLDDVKYMGATEGAFSNAKLVSLAMKHPHLSWTYSEKNHQRNASFESGVLWEKVQDKLWQVQHRLPTAYYVHWMPDDWNFWWGSSGFGDYDHRWPGENLIRQERMRFIGSSDAAFVVEITEHDKNVSKITPPELREKVQADAYFNFRHHNSVNRQFMTYYRGE